MCAVIWMSTGAAGRDNGSSIADIKNNWNHPADPAWTDPAHFGSGAFCSGAVSGERQHRGEDDRPDCGDMAFACGKLEGSVRRGRVFFTAADLWDHGEPGEDDREDDIEEPKERSAAEDTLTDGEQKTAGTPADGEKETAGISVDGEQKTDGALAGGQQKTAGILDDGPAVLGKQRGGLFRRIWERIRAFFAGLVRKLRQFRAGIKEALKKIKDVRTFLTDERHREALPLIFTELKYLLTHFKFRRIRTDLTFSMGDPAGARGLMCASVSVSVSGAGISEL